MSPNMIYFLAIIINSLYTTIESTKPRESLDTRHGYWN